MAKDIENRCISTCQLSGVEVGVQGESRLVSNLLKSLWHKLHGWSVVAARFALTRRATTLITITTPAHLVNLALSQLPLPTASSTQRL